MLNIDDFPIHLHCAGQNLVFSCFQERDMEGI